MKVEMTALVMDIKVIHCYFNKNLQVNVGFPSSFFIGSYE